MIMQRLLWAAKKIIGQDHYTLVCKPSLSSAFQHMPDKGRVQWRIFTFQESRAGLLSIPDWARSTIELYRAPFSKTWVFQDRVSVVSSMS